MRFRIGLILGLGAGYVLGAQAGRERYEQIRRWFRSVTGNPKVQEIADRGKDAAGQAGRKGAEAVQRSVSRVGTSVKDRLGNGHGGDVEVQQLGI
jgi:hypothetical protein